MLFTLQDVGSSGLILGLTALLVVYYLLGPFFDPLRDVGGPALARYTRLWELYKTWQGQLELVTIALHKQYGSSTHLIQTFYYIVLKP